MQSLYLDSEGFYYPRVETVVGVSQQVLKQVKHRKKIKRDTLCVGLKALERFHFKGDNAFYSEWVYIVPASCAPWNRPRKRLRKA